MLPRILTTHDGSCCVMQLINYTLQDFLKYWPDVDQKYDKVMVQPKSEDEKEGFAVRKFTVTGEQVIMVNNLPVMIPGLHCLLVCNC